MNGDPSPPHQPPASPPPACTVVAAVLQNRAREVGVALFDKRGGPSLDLEQHVEVGESHATTLCELQRARPGVILTLAGDRGGALGDALARFARAHDCALIELPRKQFDDIVGADLVAQCARRGSRLAPNPKDAYLAFAAASAVLQFVEHGGVSRPNHDTTASALSHRFEPFPLHESTRASPGTVVVTCSRSEHFINLDPATARVLEIATPLGPNGEPAREPTRGGQTLSSKPVVDPTSDPDGAARRAATSSPRRSLLGLLDTCATKGGSRLMKASLLQPLRDHATIATRLDAVEELLSSGTLVDECRRRLRATSGKKDVEAVTSMFAPPRKRPGSNATAPEGTPADGVNTAVSSSIDANPGKVASRIRTLLDMRRALEEVPRLGDAVRGTTSALLKEIGDVLRDPFFAGFLKHIEAVFEADVVDGRSSFSAKTRQVFAVKSGVDAFLDIARRNFCEATEAAHELIRAVRERTGLESPRLDYTANGLFRIKMTRSDFSRYSVNASHFDASLPALNPLGDVSGVHDDVNGATNERDDDGGGRVIKCTCDGLDVINSRCKEAGDEALRRSAAAVESVAAQIRANFAALGALSSALSLLDVLCAFAVRVMSSKGAYVRPVFGDDESPLAVEAGRHPVLEELPSVDFVANSTYLSPSFNTSIVTGPNGGGKSTYLRQVAVLVILAHAGCYVPARFFSSPPIDAVLARVGTCDSMETDASTFAVECRECARILERATVRSLVLVDELGRSTASAEGERFAWSVAEALMKRGCKTLFATHAERLRDLSRVYPNVRSSAMAVDLRTNPHARGGNRGGIECRYRLVDGSCDVPHYGLRAAEAFGGFPPEMMRDAWAIARRVEASSRVVPGSDGCGGGRTTVASEATAREVETAVRTAKIAERARRLCEAGGDSSNDGERERTLASLCAMAVEIVGGGAGGGACA